MPPSRRLGVSLVETLVALTLVGIGLLVLSAGVTRAVRHGGEGRANARVASALADAAATIRVMLGRRGCGATLPPLVAPGLVLSAAVEARTAHALVRLVAAHALPGGGLRRDTLALVVTC